MSKEKTEKAKLTREEEYSTIVVFVCGLVFVLSALGFGLYKLIDILQR